LRPWVASAGSESGSAGNLSPFAAAHWEVYDIEQTHGSSVWLVSTTARETIQRIEVAIR
jgi:hypothetical protein